MKEKVYRKSNPVQKNKRFGKLVWHQDNGVKTVLLDNMEWFALQHERSRLRKEAQYQSGKLKLHYQFTE